MPVPRLVTSIVDSGEPGDVCGDEFRDELLCDNSGGCPLTITLIDDDEPTFEVPSTRGRCGRAGDEVEVEPWFQPPLRTEERDDHDDQRRPGGPVTLEVCGYAPSEVPGDDRQRPPARSTSAVCRTGNHAHNTASRPARHSGGVALTLRKRDAATVMVRGCAVGRKAAAAAGRWTTDHGHGDDDGDYHGDD